MAQKNEKIAGFGARLTAVSELDKVLRGSRFSAIGADLLPDQQDRALANRLVTLALRRWGHLDLIIEQLLERGLPKRSGPFEAILRLALAELLFGAGQADHAALFVAVELCKADKKCMHLSRLLNGVLREAQRRRGAFADLPAAALFPIWLRERWTRFYGPEALEAFAQALLEGAPLDLSFRDHDPKLAQALGATMQLARSVRLGLRDRPVSELDGYAEGKWWVQDVAASLPAQLLTLPKGARVLDMCAAPGGKTAQLIAAGYQVTALDDDQERLARLRSNLDRLGMQAELVCADAAKYRPEVPFEGVLLDAPCSATGTFRRHPEVLWTRKAADIAGRAALQRKFISSAWASLQGGGQMIYATCSLEKEEGEDQADWMATNLPGLQVSPVNDGDIRGIPVGLLSKGFIRTHPAHQMVDGASGAMDGFFMARMIRTIG